MGGEAAFHFCVQFCSFIWDKLNFTIFTETETDQRLVFNLVSIRGAAASHIYYELGHIHARVVHTKTYEQLYPFPEIEHFFNGSVAVIELARRSNAVQVRLGDQGEKIYIAKFSCFF